MIRTMLMILEKYGLDSVQLGVICYLFWKLFTNHLKHVQESIDENGKDIKKLDTKVGSLTERVSKVEGRLEAKR